MTAYRAAIRDDWYQDGVKIAAATSGDGWRHTVKWPGPIELVRTEEGGAELDESCWLALPADLARALYEALADHFGHTGTDSRSLRKDYEAERARVDRFIAHLTPKETP